MGTLHKDNEILPRRGTDGKCDPSCSKLGQDNPGLVWNLIPGLKALKLIQFKSCCLQFGH